MFGDVGIAAFGYDTLASQGIKCDICSLERDRSSRINIAESRSEHSGDIADCFVVIP